MKRSLALSWILLLMVFISIISLAKGQESALKIEMEPYDWTDGMKQLSITTPKKGLILKVSIKNLNDESITLTNLHIRVEMEGEERHEFRDVQINYIYLPAEYTHNLLIEALPCGYIGDEQMIGKWTLRATYEVTTGGYGTPKNGKIEPYPFEFKVLTQDQFDKEISERAQRPFFNITVPITISIGGSVLAIAISFYFLRRLLGKVRHIR